jgi:cell wall-associated NlpC family hydrolase
MSTALTRFVFVLISLFAITGCSIFKPEKTPVKPPKSSTRKVPAGASSAGIRFRYGVVDDAEQFVGSNYKYAGRDPKTGFDCSGFTSYVLARHDVKVSPASSMQSKEGRAVALDRVLPGDLVFFAQDGKTVSHVALVVERGKNGITVIHSTTSRGVIIENVSTSTYWKNKILFARDVIGNSGK